MKRWPLILILWILTLIPLPVGWLVLVFMSLNSFGDDTFRKLEDYQVKHLETHADLVFGQLNQGIGVEDIEDYFHPNMPEGHLQPPDGFEESYFQLWVATPEILVYSSTQGFADSVHGLVIKKYPYTDLPDLEKKLKHPITRDRLVPLSPRVYYWE